MYQHVEPVTDVKQINRAAVGMFVCNFFAMELSIVGLLAVAYVADLATASVPMLVLVQNGVGAGVLTPVISLLIILGAISTAVNMISGIVTRVRKRSGTANGFSGKKKTWPSCEKRGVYSDLYLPGFRHRPVRTDDSSQQRLCLSGLCGFDHSVYSFCTPLDHDKGERNLNIV